MSMAMSSKNSHYMSGETDVDAEQSLLGNGNSSALRRSQGRTRWLLLLTVVLLGAAVRGNVAEG